jgi:hypothetical protein
VEGEVRDERLREGAKQLLRVAYERRVVDGVEMMQVDLGTAAEHRGLDPRSPHIRFAGGLHGGRGLGRAGPHRWRPRR